MKITTSPATLNRVSQKRAWGEARIYDPRLSIKLLLLLIILAGWRIAPAAAGLDDCVEATCRVRASDGSTGTGCVFHRSAGRLYVLTNAHVAGTTVGEYVDVEFWKQGYPSQAVRGRNAWVSFHDSASRDIAIVAVEESELSGVLPAIIPIGEDPSESPQQYETIISVGCANGAWPTAWHGHVEARADELGSVIHFQPPPAGGRSGSAIFDAAGTKIIGLIAWRAADDSHGIAMTLDELHAALGGQPPTVDALWASGSGRGVEKRCVLTDVWPAGASGSIDPHRRRRVRPLTNTDCGPFGCWPDGGNRGGGGGGGRGVPPRGQPPGGGYSPWNGGGGTGGRVPPAGGVTGGDGRSAVPEADLDALSDRVDRLEEQGLALGQSLQARIAAVESRVGQVGQGVAAADAVQEDIATAVTELQADVATVEEQVVQTHQVAAEASTRIETSEKSLLQKMGTYVTESKLIERYDQAKADGALAGREAAAAAAKDLLSDKLAGIDGFSLGRAAAHLLGIGGPAGLGIALAGWFMRRKVVPMILDRFDGHENYDGAGEAPSRPFRGNRKTVPHAGGGGGFN